MTPQTLQIRNSTAESEWDEISVTKDFSVTADQTPIFTHSS